METLVVGAGEMGRWFARATGWSPTFADVDPEAADVAARELGGDTAPIDGDDRFDVVCIAVPIPAVREAVEAHSHRADRAIVDVTGIMEPALEAMADNASGLERASLHPLFSAANAPGTVALAVGREGSTIDALRRALVESGNDLLECTADEHDEAMETIQGAAHAAVLAYGLAAQDVPTGFHTPVSDGLDDLVRQVTDGDPRVYADIQQAYDGASAVAEAAQHIGAADREEFRELYRRAAATALERTADGGSDP